MTRGYWIAHVTVTDPDRYKDYVTANAKAFSKYGARFLVRGGAGETIAGSIGGRHVVLEFADIETAWACYRSPEYQAAQAIRDEASTAEIVIVEGYDGPQPGEG